jgi:hypothetical protein
MGNFNKKCLFYNEKSLVGLTFAIEIERKITPKISLKPFVP